MEKKFLAGIGIAALLYISCAPAAPQNAGNAEEQEIALPDISRIEENPLFSEFYNSSPKYWAMGIDVNESDSAYLPESYKDRNAFLQEHKEMPDSMSFYDGTRFFQLSFPGTLADSAFVLSKGRRHICAPHSSQKAAYWRKLFEGYARGRSIDKNLVAAILEGYVSPCN